MKTKHFLIPGIALFFGLLSGCYAGAQTRASVVIPLEGRHHTDTVITHELPPHAPRHGYRHRHYDHDLQYDSGFGAYVVIGSPGLYFYGGNYLRFHNDRWQITARLRNSWRFADEHDIPRKLHQLRHRNRHNEVPENDHRRRHQGHELSYDSRVGAYAIVQRPGIYFHNNRYLRRHKGVWQSASKLNGNWRPAKKQHVPGTLKKARHVKKDRHKRKEKRRH